VDNKYLVRYRDVVVGRFFTLDEAMDARLKAEVELKKVPESKPQPPRLPRAPKPVNPDASAGIQQVKGGWKARVYVSGDRKSLDVFSTKEAAQAARAEALAKLERGEQLVLNERGSRNAKGPRELPTGITKVGDRFRARYGTGTVGVYDDLESAVAAYEAAKA